MKRDIIIGVMLSIFLATGCTSEDINTVSNEGNKYTRQEIVIWSYYETIEQKSMLSNLSEGFNTSQNKYSIQWEYVPMDSFNKRLTIGFTQNDLPDMVIIDHPNMYFYISLGLFEDITDKIADWNDKEQYFDASWQSTLYNERVYGIPFSSNNIALFYNIDMFEKAGISPPESWAELIHAAKQLTKDGVNGFGMAALQSEQGTFQFLPWLYSTDISLDNINTEEGVKAFQLIADLVQDGSLSKECINWSQNDVSKKFIARELAMMENGPWVLPVIQNGNVNFRWGIVKLPVDKKNTAVLGGENIAVIKGRNVQGALEFIKFLGDFENVKKYSWSAGAIPPRKDVAMESEWSQDPMWNIFVNQMDYAQLRTQHIRWPLISETISSELQNVIIGTTSPEIAIERIKGNIEKIKNES